MGGGGKGHEGKKIERGSKRKEKHKINKKQLVYKCKETEEEKKVVAKDIKLV